LLNFLNMESTRQQKVNRLIQKEIGNLLQRESHQLCNGKMVTVTSVRMTPDLGLARVNISIFPSNANKETLEVIKSQSKHIRNELGRSVRNQLRIVPELDFFIDDSLDYIEKIDLLLKK